VVLEIDEISSLEVLLFGDLLERKQPRYLKLTLGGSGVILWLSTKRVLFLFGFRLLKVHRSLVFSTLQEIEFRLRKEQKMSVFF